jgi:hypothetical protein
VISGPLAILIALKYSLDSYLAVDKYLVVKQRIFANENTSGSAIVVRSSGLD